MKPNPTYLAACLILLSACTTPAPDSSALPAAHQPAEEAAVLEAMDRFMTAITESDYETMAAMQMPDAMTFQGRPLEDGEIQIGSMPMDFLSDPANDSGADFRERYWSPTVLIRSGIATVWAPYEFWVDGETSHCGVDVFNFVEKDGEWLVAGAVWTIEPDACDELRPADASVLRPQG